MYVCICIDRDRFSPPSTPQVTIGTLTCGVRGEPPIVEGELHGRVRADEAMWQLQDSHRLVVTVPKLQIERQTWWPCVMVGEPEINTDK